MSVCLHRREWRVHFYREDRISGHRVKLPSAFSLPFYRTLPPLNFALPLLTFNPFGVYLLFLHLFPFFSSSFFFSKLCPSPRRLRSTIHILLGATIRRDFAASFQRLTPVPSQFLHFQTLWRLCDALRNCFENTRNIEHLVQVAVYNKPVVCTRKYDSLYSRVQAYKNGTIYRRRLFSYYKKKEVDGYYHKKSLFYLIVIHE